MFRTAPATAAHIRMLIVASSTRVYG